MRAAVPAGVSGAYDGVDARLDAVASAHALARALAVLGPSERDALLLHAWTDLSYEQIAEALAIPVGTVRSRLHRARRQLRASMTEQEDAVVRRAPEEVR